MKKILLTLLFVIAFIPTIVKAENLSPTVDKTKKVYDLAEVLSEEEESKLHDMVSAFISKYEMDMVVAIINENPYGISDDFTRIYSQDFYWYNGFGVGGNRSGIIFFVDLANRYPYITTRGEATLMYDDYRIEKMHDSAYDYLSSGDYYEAFRHYIDSASEYAKEGIPSSNSLYCVNDNGDIYKCKETPKSVNWLLTIVIATLGSLIPVFVHLRKYKGIRIATDANNYLKDVAIVNSTDQFLSTFTSRTRINHDSGSSGGGRSGGGSSISHGSGGSFGGGGGRHF